MKTRPAVEPNASATSEAPKFRLSLERGGAAPASPVSPPASKRTGSEFGESERQSEAGPDGDSEETGDFLGGSGFRAGGLGCGGIRQRQGGLPCLYAVDSDFRLCRGAVEIDRI